MADLVNTPQIRLPLEIMNGDVPVVEQDSEEDRIQNAAVCLRYVKGQRTALPRYGIPDQSLRQGGLSPEEVVQHVQTWEPDVDLNIVRQAIDTNGEQYVTVEIDPHDPNPTPNA